VVASNTTSLPEILGNAAVLVDPDDMAAIATAISEVLSSERDELESRDGIDHARQFTWDRASDQLIDVLRGV
ncbi:MAG TPA: hypothetical protein VFJ06_11550, partial [Halococcus sp.]|nr:hypothetical protein [Halococcus sp.]